jgi:serine/threonine protein kinase
MVYESRAEPMRARDTRLNRTVAVKIWREKFRDRFEREARAIAALNHPNIGMLYDVGSNYLIMEPIDGPTLADSGVHPIVSRNRQLAVPAAMAASSLIHGGERFFPRG